MKAKVINKKASKPSPADGPPKPKASAKRKASSAKAEAPSGKEKKAVKAARAASVSAAWSNDEAVSRAIRSIADLASTFDVDTATAELLSLFKSRPISKVMSNLTSTLTGGNNVGLTDAVLKTQAIRSSVVSIRLGAMIVSMQGERIMDSAKSFLRTNYAASLQAAESTVSGRQALVDAVFADGKDAIRAVDGVIALADALIADLDSAGWAFKTVKDTLTIGAREG